MKRRNKNARIDYIKKPKLKSIKLLKYRIEGLSNGLKTTLLAKQSKKNNDAGCKDQIYPNNKKQKKIYKMEDKRSASRIYEMHQK